MEQGISAGDSAQAAIQADFRRPCLTYNQLSPMSYQVLARKYRPQKFSEVIGQEHVTRTLKNAIEQGRDRFKIYILDEAHQITDAAFNALLKTLEEPPSHVVFMLATTQPEDIPQTIRSRCQHFSFRAVRFEEIVGQLKDLIGRENIEADEDGP